MDMMLVLLGLRLAGTAVLLLFMASVAVMMYRDLRRTSTRLTSSNQPRGTLYAVATGESYPLWPVTGLGRALSNQIVVDDGYTSSRHALITLRGERWWLEDLGSRNGTLLNDMPLTEAVVLGAGDVVTVGQTQFRVVF
jgi:pSer/pThr/pTyr-binding forkhead associated (FHA) protein